MVYINTLRIERGKNHGEEVSENHMWSHCKKTEVSSNSDLFESLSRRAIVIEQKKQHKVLDKKTGEWKTIEPQTLFSAGHGVEVKPSSMNKEGSGKVIESKTGRIDENKSIWY